MAPVIIADGILWFEVECTLLRLCENGCYVDIENENIDANV